MIAAVVALGRTPHCVLEITETGQGRLSRIFRLLESCRVSVHDLSRVGRPPRFNMPFELGLAHAIRRHRGTHSILLLEARTHRLGKTLSDLAGHDPQIHEGKPRLVVAKILSALGTSGADPDPSEVQALRRTLWQVSRRLLAAHSAESVFDRGVFRRLVTAATLEAADRGLISS